MSQRFRALEKVIYPTHGLGTIVSTGPYQQGDTALMYVISFPQHKMKLMVPVNKAESLRPISSQKMMREALNELIRPREKSKRLWSQRAAKYSSDLHSGDTKTTAILTRNLYATDVERAQGKQSYSERVIYDEAFMRLAEELAAVAEIDLVAAEALIDEALTTKELPNELKKL